MSTPASASGAGTWWRSSSLAQPSLSDKLQFHAEAQLSYEWKTGNLEGNEQNGDAMMALRWNRFTNYILFEIDNQTYDVIPSNASFEQRRWAVEEILRVDLTRLFYFDVDVLFNEDTSIYLTRRLGGYAGPGVYLQFGKFNISFQVGAGADSKEYIPAVSFADRDGAALFFGETIHYQLTPMTEISQLTRFVKLIDYAGFSEYNFKVSVTQAITRTVALLFLFEYSYSDVDIPGVVAGNTDQGIGLQLML
ncbi:DUF481 domain-containing protein [bacterium]|nr:DUF481 domain-containing protein [bacterium]